jgi:hypothetical protein
LRRDAASSFDIGFPRPVEQFALPILPGDVTVFRRDSFLRDSFGAARVHTTGELVG